MWDLYLEYEGDLKLKEPFNSFESWNSNRAASQRRRL